jgi:hypothetical protein
VRLFHAETNALGVTRRYYADDDGNITVEAEQDLEPLLERNKALANENGKRIASDYSNPIASIPPVIVVKWLTEEGWNVFDAQRDPEVQKKLNRKLNDPDWRFLRTSELRV